MSEKRFLSLVLTKGIILIILGISLLILPKLTEITFGLLLSLVMIVYGGYKSIISFLSRNFESHFILNIVSGILLFVGGILLFFAPIVETILIVLIIGIYFILESINSSIFALQVIDIFYFWRAEILAAVIQILFGISLSLIFPSLWIAGIFISIDFLISGLILLNMYFSKKYIQ